MTGRRRWVEKPSPLFEVLLAADRRNRTTWSWTYYERAMAVAHEVAAIDAHVGRLELVALEQLRSTLLRAVAAAAIARPGGTTTTPAAGADAAGDGAAAAPTPGSHRPGRSRSCWPSSTRWSGSTSSSARSSSSPT